MRTFKYILLLAPVVIMQSCVKDPLDDIKKGGWNHERTILDIKFENQVGNPTIETIDSNNGEITLAINIDAVPDLSNIKIEKLQLSYQATSSLKPNDVLDFENPDKSAFITVKAATGEERKYKITVSEFSEPLVGVYQITNLVVYGGTGVEYGGGGVMPLSDKAWCWSESYGPNAENDNTLTFEMTGVTDDGNTMGICLNDAGLDGKYADFIFAGAMNKENPGIDIDLKKFYRQIPEGKSEWVRDYAAGVIRFTSEKGVKTAVSYLTSSTEDFGNGLSFTINNFAFAANLSGSDDWNNIYSDYDKFVKKPRRFYITADKVN